MHGSAPWRTGGPGRSNEPSVLILTSLAGGPKHGYALTKDIARFAGVTLGPGTLYGAIARLEEGGFIVPEPAAAEGRRRPYRITGAGLVALEEAVRQMRSLADEGAARLGLTPLSPAFGIRREAGLRPLAALVPARVAGPLRRRNGGVARGHLRLWPPPCPGSVQFELARSGLAERARAVGVIDPGPGRPSARRDGSLLVLVGWVALRRGRRLLRQVLGQLVRRHSGGPGP